jgi:hypothetical protein
MAGATEVGTGAGVAPVVVEAGIFGVGVKETVGGLGALTGDCSLLDSPNSLKESLDGLASVLGSSCIWEKENSGVGLEGPGVLLAFSFPFEDCSG